MGVESDLKQAGEYVETYEKLRDALQIPEGAGVEVHHLAQGEHNDNFWFEHPMTGQKLVLRINHASQFGLDNQIGYEFAVLQAVVPSGRTPRPLFVDKSAFEHGALIMEFLEGEPLDFSKPHHLLEAAAVLADIHAVDPPDQPGAAIEILEPRDTLENLFEESRGFYEMYRKSALADNALVARLERFIESSRRELVPRRVSNPRRHMVNTEAVPGHFLMENRGDGVVRGSFIDWDKALVGENTRDVAYFLAPTSTVWDSDFMFDESGRRDFIDAYWKAVAGRFDMADFEQRFNSYMKLNCLRGTTWSAMTWVEYQRPDRELKNQKTLDKLKKYYLDDSYLDMLEDVWFSK